MSSRIVSQRRQKIADTYSKFNKGQFYDERFKSKTAPPHIKDKETVTNILRMLVTVSV